MDISDKEMAEFLSKAFRSVKGDAWKEAALLITMDNQEEVAFFETAKDANLIEEKRNNITVNDRRRTKDENSKEVFVYRLSPAGHKLIRNHPEKTK